MSELGLSDVICLLETPPKQDIFIYLVPRKKGSNLLHLSSDIPLCAQVKNMRLYDRDDEDITLYINGQHYRFFNNCFFTEYWESWAHWIRSKDKLCP